nr:hypothetical protein [Tanacetum cinerariifolium]
MSTLRSKVSSMRELREDTFSGNKNDDAHEHVEIFWTSSICSTFQESHMMQSCFVYSLSLLLELQRDGWTDYLYKQSTPRTFSKRISLKGIVYHLKRQSSLRKSTTSSKKVMRQRTKHGKGAKPMKELNLTKNVYFMKRSRALRKSSMDSLDDPFQIMEETWLDITEDLDAYDSDCDDIASAKAVLMANLSSCDSDVLFEMNRMVNESLSTELERYKERVTIFEQRRTDTSSLVNHNAYMASSSAPQIAYAPMDQHSSEYSPPEAGLVVPVFQKGDDPIDAINHMMSFLTSVVASRYPATNNQLRTSSNPRQQATINNGRVKAQGKDGLPKPTWSAPLWGINTLSLPWERVGSY